MTETVLVQNSEVTEGNGKPAVWPEATLGLTQGSTGTLSQANLVYSIDLHNEQTEEIIRERIIGSCMLAKTASRVPIRKVIKDKLNEVFNLITDACDQNIDIAERSNYFDDWKTELSVLTRRAEHFSKNHNIVIGAVINATHKLDITDFNDDILTLFQRGTNFLRQSVISKKEKKEVISGLVRARLKVSLPLGVEDLAENSQQTIELKAMVEKIVEKSRIEL